jgi:hypothetical protein
MDKQEQQIDLNKMTKEDAMQIIWTALNKASTKGVFTLDESYVIKTAFMHFKQIEAK